jgi:hypothetical protein
MFDGFYGRSRCSHSEEREKARDVEISAPRVEPNTPLSKPKMPESSKKKKFHFVIRLQNRYVKKQRRFHVSLDSL